MEHQESDVRRRWKPTYSDFEFYKAGTDWYRIHYIASTVNNTVYVLGINSFDFHVLVRELDLSRNPFDEGCNHCTSTVIWKKIAAYCRTYGTPMTKEKAEAWIQSACIEKDGECITKPIERLSHEDLQKHTDVWLHEHIRQMRNGTETYKPPEGGGFMCCRLKARLFANCRLPL